MTRPTSHWASVWVLAAGAFTVNLDARAIVPLLPSLAEDLGVGIAAAGLIVTAYMIPYGALQLVYGPLADRWGRLPIARGTLLGFGVGAAACGLADSLQTLTILRVLTGATAAAVFPMGLAHIGDAFAYRDRPAAISILITASASAQLLSLVLGGLLAEFVTWRAIFFLTGGLAFLAAAGLFWVRGQAPTESSAGGTVAAYRKVFARRSALILPLLAFVEGALLNGALSYLGAFLRERWGLSYALIGLILGAYGVANLVASRLLGWAARRVPEPTRFLAGALLSVLGYGLVAVVDAWQAMIAVSAILGLGFVAAHSVLQARATEAAPGVRGTAIAVFACGLFMGGALGTAAIGSSIDVWGYERVMVGVAAGTLAFAYAGWVALRRDPTDAKR